MRSGLLFAILIAACGDPMSSSAVGSGGALPDGSTTPGPDPASSVDPCNSASLGDGAYCGAGIGGDTAALYDCALGKTVKKTPCTYGCQANPPGVSDACKDFGAYHLPWACGASYETTQGNHGDICGSNGGDHTGTQAYAWDFGIPRHTPILAARGGTVTAAVNAAPPGAACHDGCTQPFGSSAFWDCCNGCIGTANFVNVQHADGTVASYFHLDAATAQVGAHVAAGDLLGYSGTSGCSSGPHLHFQVMGDCPTGFCQSIAMQFEEAGAPACGASVTSADAC